MAYEFSFSLDPMLPDITFEPLSDDDEGRVAAKKNWEHENRLLLRRGTLEMPSDFFPISLRLIEGKELVDMSNFRPLGKWLVSPAFRDLVEQFEPGLHQFLPVKVFYKNGNFYREMFYFRIMAKIDVINPVLGGLKQEFYTKDPIKEPDAFFWGVKFKSDDKLAVFKDRVAGRAIWCAQRFPVSEFMSDEFHRQAIDSKLLGFRTKCHWKEL